MHVIATAGHVDHGKSTLVRALTGMEPDRWAEERRRGMTIDLGYAWTTLPSGETLAFVDVPGHQRFIGNMLAGLGPAPAVLLIVAADEGWREQSTEHFAAVAALGIRHGLVVVTKADLADPGPAMQAARRRVTDTALAGAEVVAVSAVSGNGIADVQAALSRLVRKLPAPDVGDRVRLWVDRAFTIRGSGTVVTGTLGGGTVRVDDQLVLRGRPVSVRALRTLGEEQAQVSAVSRLAINLRSVARDDVRRGDALLTTDAWRLTSTVDVRLVPVPAGLLPPDDSAGGPTRQDGAQSLAGNGFGGLPADLMLFLGTAAVPVHVRPLDAQFGRLRLDVALPLQVGDHAILSDRTRHHLPRGVLILDADPVPFRRRGAAAARTAELTAAGGTPALRDHVRWRGAVRLADLQAWGVPVTDRSGVHDVGDWLIDNDRWTQWSTRLAAAVDLQARREPQNPTLGVDRARSEIGAPDRAVIGPLAAAAGLRVVRGELGRPERVRSLGTAEGAVRDLETRLQDDAFAAPDREDLDRLGLIAKDLAVAAAIGRLLRVDDDIVLLPDAPARAMRILATLPAPFTTSQARQALGTTRRVVIPLLEYLDRKGWTQRLDSGHRVVRR